MRDYIVTYKIDTTKMRDTMTIPIDECFESDKSGFVSNARKVLTSLREGGDVAALSCPKSKEPDLSIIPIVLDEFTPTYCTCCDEEVQDMNAHRKTEKHRSKYALVKHELMGLLTERPLRIDINEGEDVSECKTDK